jgi:hypothetical protein
MNSIVHFENRRHEHWQILSFYNSLFGWKISESPVKMIEGAGLSTSAWTTSRRALRPHSERNRALSRAAVSTEVVSRQSPCYTCEIVVDGAATTCPELP